MRKCGGRMEDDMGTGFRRTKFSLATVLMVLVVSLSVCYGGTNELSQHGAASSPVSRLEMISKVMIKDLSETEAEVNVNDKDGFNPSVATSSSFPPPSSNGQLPELESSEEIHSVTSTIAPSVTTVSSRYLPPVFVSPSLGEESLSEPTTSPLNSIPTSVSMTAYATAIEKPSNINLLRKLWSSTRHGKLNLTQEHESLLRIEPLTSNVSSSSFSQSIGKLDLQDLLRSSETSLSTSSAITSPPSSSDEPSTAAAIATSPTPFQLTTSLSSNKLPSDTFLNPTDDSYTKRVTMKAVEPVGTPVTTVDFYSDKNYRPKWNHPKMSSTSTQSSSSSSVFHNNMNKISRNQMLYPEWLSSGGVYPDDTNNNATGEYYGEPEYETLLSAGSGENSQRNANSNYPEEENPRRSPIRKRINDEERGTRNRIRANGHKDKSSSDGLSPSSSLSRHPSTESPQAIIAQSGLADVISRGRIDSVMYVYFGDNKYNDYHKEEVAGRIIQAVGGVVAAVAQVLTVLGAAKCVRKTYPTSALPVHLHIGFALLISNLLLLLAVHATEPADVCATVALILHYLHLVIGCWLFAHTVQTYRALCRHVAAPNLLSPPDPTDQPSDVFRVARPSTLRYSLAAWSAPFPFILMSYVANPDGYETHHYCWMSIEKGMVVSFIVPVFLLIGLNTCLVVLSLRHLLALRKLWHDPSVDVDEDTLDEKIISSGIRASAMLLPLLAIMWFLGVVALENATSIFFQLAAAVANIALSWLVMYFLGDEIWPDIWCHFSKSDRSMSSSSIEEPCSAQPSSVQPGAQISFDSEPLLGAPSSSSASSSVTGKMSAVAVASTSSSSLSTTATTSSVNSIPASSSSSSSTARAAAPANAPTSIPGPSTSASASSKRSSGKKHQRPLSKKPNWSQPGGNEIYELRLDAISTIYK